MRRINLVRLAPLVLLGCSGGSGGNPGTGGASDNGNQVVSGGNPGTTHTACEGDCEGPALMMKKISGPAWGNVNLTPNEHASLKQALQTTSVKGPNDTPHIHADAAAGQLSFSSERTQDPTHLTGQESLITIGLPSSRGSSTPVRVVATPAAAKLLEQKAAVVAH